MSSKQNKRSNGHVATTLKQLESMLGEGDALDVEALDARILWAVAVSLARHGCNFTLGCTRSQDAWVLQIWDGDYPVKKYFTTTEKLNWSLAGCVRAYEGADASTEVEALLTEYGW